MENDIIELLKVLVTLDSQNPSLVPGAAGESRIAAYVADWASSVGLASQTLKTTPGRPGVLVRSHTDGTARSLMLCGQLDTVGVGQMSDPLTPVIDGYRLYGRGAYDMKAGCHRRVGQPVGHGCLRRDPYRGSRRLLPVTKRTPPASQAGSHN